MKGQYFYNPKTRRIHIAGYCQSAITIPEDAVVFETEADALAFGGDSLGICKNCLKKKEGLQNGEKSKTKGQKNTDASEGASKKGKISKIVGIVILAIIALTGLVGFFALSDPGTIFVVLTIVVTLAIYIIVKKQSQEAREDERTNLLMVSKNCLYVLKAESKNASALKMEKHRRTSYKYNPATITYTGATVGGVTTGGFSYDEAHYTSKAEGFTGKYDLWYTDVDKKLHLVTDIELSKSLVTSAKKNKTVAQFLKDNTLHLKHEDAKSEHHDAIAWAAKNKDMDIYELTNLMLPELEAKMLNKNEMQAVLDFICGK